jgi:hypothetical protein
MKAASPLCLQHNAIFAGRFIRSGEVLDEQTLASLPATLRKYLIPVAAESEEPEQVVAGFQLNTSYRLDREGRMLARNLERQAADQASAAEFADAMEAQVISEIENPDQTIADALAQAQADHDASVNLQIAQAEIDARRAREATEHFETKQSAESVLADAEGYSPSLDEDAEISRQQPKRLRTRYVLRDGEYVRAKKVATLRINEQVFVKEGTSYVAVGKVNRKRKLPLIYVQES